MKIWAVSIKLFLLFLMFTLLSACSKDHSPEVIQAPICNTLNISYITSVKPILKQNCYGCHSAAIVYSGGGFDVETFASLKGYLVQYYQKDSIYGSAFSHIINQNGKVVNMPPLPNSKMTSCELAIIDSWINAGAPEN